MKVQALILLLATSSAVAQSTFQNLDFEDSTLTVVLVNPYGPYYATNATLPGWTPNTVPYNTFALEAAAVTLHGADDPSFPAFAGNYSILLQGGWPNLPPELRFGASIFQTGSIPATAHSLIYLANGILQVSFNGQSLSPVALGTTPRYVTWGIDISAYAGQTGELRFAVPWTGGGMLDDIQFSPSSIPEPSGLALLALATAVLSSRFLRGSRAHQ